jgi:NADH-quinone oxidoreductase subunit J
MLAEVLFIYLAAAIVVLSVLVITRSNPVHSVLTMLLLFFHIAALYVTLNAEFLAAVQVIVYAGAILVLFLFVVLLLNLKEEAVERRYVGPWPMGLMAATGLFLAIVVSLDSFVAGPKGPFTEYLYPFEVVSLVLLVAIVGAIVLAKKRLRS